MTTNARKTDAQRLGNGKKAFNVKQVEKMIEQGGGGTEYTAGTGIVIESNEISADISVLQPKLTAGSGINIDADNVISATGGDGWTLVTSDNESDLIGSDYVLKKDIMIKISHTDYVSEFLYLPKGLDITNRATFFNVRAIGGFNAPLPGWGIVYYLSKIFDTPYEPGSSHTTPCDFYIPNVYDGGSGSNVKLMINVGTDSKSQKSLSRTNFIVYMK